MMRKVLTTSVALAAVIVGTAGGPGRTVFIGDFADGNNDGWSTFDATPAQKAVFDASSGAYVLDSTVAVPTNDPLVGTMVSTWERARGQPKFSNGTLRGTMRANTAGSTVGFLLRANDNPESESDYGFF